MTNDSATSPKLMTRAFVLLNVGHFLQGLGYASMLLLPRIEIAGNDMGPWINLAGAVLFVVVIVSARGSQSTDESMGKPTEDVDS